MEAPAAGQRGLGGAVDGDAPADQHDQRDIGQQVRQQQRRGDAGIEHLMREIADEQEGHDRRRHGQRHHHHLQQPDRR